MAQVLPRFVPASRRVPLCALVLWAALPLLACNNKGGGGGGLVLGPPIITAQPASISVVEGQPASFSVTASENNAPPLSFQWQRGGADLAGATAASLRLASTALPDNGAAFAVVVTNPKGSVTSASATLSVTAAPVAPTITTQPANQTVPAGRTATFTVVASGTAPLAYQWKRNGTAIAGSTAATHTTLATVVGDSGALFTVVVSNVAGSLPSSAATLTVTPVGPAALVTGKNVSSPRVAIAPSGEALVVWKEDLTIVPASSAVWVSRFDVATGAWTAPLRLDAATGFINPPVVGLDAAGNGWSAWLQSGSPSKIVARRYTAATQAWAPEVTALANDSLLAPALAVAPSGVATLLFGLQPAGITTWHMHASRSAPSGAAWSAPQNLELPARSDLSDADHPAVAVNGEGDLGAAWIRAGGFPGSFPYGAAFDEAAGTWSAPQSIAFVSTTSAAPAIDGAGNAYVYMRGGLRRRSVATGVWSAVAGAPSSGLGDVSAYPGGNLLVANLLVSGAVDVDRYDGASTWSAPFSATTSNAELARIATSANGDAFATWQRFVSGQRLVRGTRFRASSGQFDANATLGRATILDSGLSDLAMNATGAVAIAGVESPGATAAIWASWIGP